MKIRKAFIHLIVGIMKHKAVKLLLVCLTCIALVTAIVLVVQYFMN